MLVTVTTVVQVAAQVVALAVLKVDQRPLAMAQAALAA